MIEGDWPWPPIAGVGSDVLGTSFALLCQAHRPSAVEGMIYIEGKSIEGS